MPPSVLNNEKIEITKFGLYIPIIGQILAETAQQIDDRQRTEPWKTGVPSAQPPRFKPRN